MGKSLWQGHEWSSSLSADYYLCHCFQVLRTSLSNRLAKVQGFLFRAAFLRRVPLFFRLISENILLCFLLSTMHATSKYITGILSLRFRKILTRLIHAHYFEVLMVAIFGCQIAALVFCFSPPPPSLSLVFFFSLIFNFYF